MASNPLWEFYYRGEKKNKSHYHAYCKFCVDKYELDHPPDVSEAINAAEIQALRAAAHEAARQAVGSTRGEKSALVAHFLGGKGITACDLLSSTAKKEAKRQRSELQEEHGKKAATSAGPKKRAAPTIVESDEENTAASSSKKSKQSHLTGFNALSMPISNAEKDAIQAQALRAVISTNSSFRLFEDYEMRKLFKMIRSAAPAVLPSAKVVGGRLLNDASQKVERKIKKVMRGQNVGLCTDGWKSRNKSSVAALCANVDFKTYPLKLLNTTALKKDGPSQCNQFAEMIDETETDFECIVIYLTTDADGGSKKGRLLLGKKRHWLLLPSCWAHQVCILHYESPFMGLVCWEGAILLKRPSKNPSGIIHVRTASSGFGANDSRPTPDDMTTAQRNIFASGIRCQDVSAAFKSADTYYISFLSNF
ncbi:hypothetical protein C8J56DRAFT_1116967 [Mycena floridula]|nr:hypothetical protein C8J56DRAFT_1116967 [Mycena floridula]